MLRKNRYCNPRDLFTGRCSWKTFSHLYKRGNVQDVPKSGKHRLIYQQVLLTLRAPILAYQSHASEHAEPCERARKALASFATSPFSITSSSIYGEATGYFSHAYNPRLASSTRYITHYVNALRNARILLIGSRRVIKTRWPLVECITTSAWQWRQRGTVVWLVPDNCQELLLIGRYSKRLWPPLQAHLLPMLAAAVLIGQCGHPE